MSTTNPLKTLKYSYRNIRKFKYEHDDTGILFKEYPEDPKKHGRKKRKKKALNRCKKMI